MKSLRGIVFIFFVVFCCSHDYRFAAVSAQTLKWSLTVGDTVLTPIVAGKQFCYFGTNLNDAQLRAVDISTGVVNWTYFPGATAQINSAPIVANGLVYFGTSLSRYFALNETTGVQQWSAVMQGAVHNDAVMDPARQTLFVGDDGGKFHAINAVTGALIWTFQAGSPVRGSPALDSAGNVYFGCLNASFYCLTRNGAMLWRYDGLSGAASKLLVLPDNSLVLGGSAAGDIHAIFASGINVGLQKYRYYTGVNQPQTTQLLESNGTFYVGVADGSLHAIQAASGGLLWKYQAVSGPGAFVTAPIADRGLIFFGGSDGKIHSVNATTKNVQNPDHVYSVPGAGVFSKKPFSMQAGFIILSKGTLVVAVTDPTAPTAAPLTMTSTNSPDSAVTSSPTTTTRVYAYPFSTYVSNPAGKFLSARAASTTLLCFTTAFVVLVLML